MTIRGRGAERDLAFPPPGTRRRAAARHERPDFRPDRAAMWAVLLGVLLVLVAATSSHAAALSGRMATHRATARPAALVTQAVAAPRATLAVRITR